MPQESTTPDLVERWRHVADALGRSDFDSGLSCFAPDAVWEVQPLASSFEGVPAIRSFVEAWIGNYDEYQQELVEGQDLGNDVVFAVNRQDARLAGTTSRVQELWSFTVTWRAGRIDRVIGRNDIDEAVLPPSASQRSGADESQERWTIFLLYAESLLVRATTRPSI